MVEQQIVGVVEQKNLVVEQQFLARVEHQNLVVEQTNLVVEQNCGWSVGQSGCQPVIQASSQSAIQSAKSTSQSIR